MNSDELNARRDRLKRRSAEVRDAVNHLQRDFEASGPNQNWAADVTCICTAEGWLYAAAVMDL